MTPNEIDFLRLFAEVDNNNKIDFSKFPDDDDAFEKLFWSYYPTIDYKKLNLNFYD
jgi:hypothetical protein